MNSTENTPVTSSAPQAGANIPTEQERDEWFAQMFHSLSIDKIRLDTNTATKEQRDFYDALIRGDKVMAHGKAKERIDQELTKAALVKFIVALLKNGHLPNKIAFNNDGASLLVWAVVGDDDFATESALYLAQASVNSELEKANYVVSATIVDESDRLAIPPHYEEWLFPRK